MRVPNSYGWQGSGGGGGATSGAFITLVDADMPFSASATLNDQTYMCDLTVAGNLVLPDSTTATAGFRLYVIWFGVGQPTVIRAGADVIFWDPAVPTGSTSFIIPTRFSSLGFVSDGAGGWHPR